MQGDKTGRRALLQRDSYQESKISLENEQELGRKNPTSQYEIRRAAVYVMPAPWHMLQHMWEKSKHWQKGKGVHLAKPKSNPSLSSLAATCSFPPTWAVLHSALTTVTSPVTGSNQPGWQRAAHQAPQGTERGAQKMLEQP